MENKSQIELLAPAGNWEVLQAVAEAERMQYMQGAKGSICAASGRI